MEKGNCNVRKPSNLIKTGQSYKRSLWTEILISFADYSTKIALQFLSGKNGKRSFPRHISHRKTFFKHEVLGFAYFESLVEVSVLLIPRLYTQSPIAVAVAAAPRSSRFLQFQKTPMLLNERQRVKPACAKALCQLSPYLILKRNLTKCK
jgi:hypothetical protein